MQMKACRHGKPTGVALGHEGRPVGTAPAPEKVMAEVPAAIDAPAPAPEPVADGPQPFSAPEAETAPQAQVYPDETWSVDDLVEYGKAMNPPVRLDKRRKVKTMLKTIKKAAEAAKDASNGSAEA
jgi:hypothetical protein